MEHNVLWLCVCLPTAQSFNLTTNVDGANSTKPLLYAGRYYSTNVELKHRTKVLLKKIAERWQKKI